MSSDDTREESCTDPNGQICDHCGDTYNVETIAGPGEARRSCGCRFTPTVADDTDNALANMAIRALNAAGDVETAARIHEGTHGRSVGDSNHEPDYECRHCDWAGDECDRRDHYPVCPECSRIVEVRQELVADGSGVPENFEDLASTCENCGDNVDPERLIEGECPGCHYHEPVADGGVAWTDLHAFQRDIVEAIRRLDQGGETTYGLAIMDELERVRNGESPSRPSLPRTSTTVVEYGLVEKRRARQADERVRADRPGRGDARAASATARRRLWDGAAGRRRR